MASVTITNEQFNEIRELLDSKGYTDPVIAIIIIEDTHWLTIRDSGWQLIGTISKKSNATQYDQ